MKGNDALFIFFDTDTEARIIKSKVYDGTAIIDNKLFYVDKNNPINVTYKEGFSKKRMPLYVVKWNSVTPSNIEAKAVNKPKLPKGMIAQEANPEMIEKPSIKFKEYERDLTPEYISKLIELKIMGNLLGRKKDFNIILLIIMMLVGALIAYFMFKSGYIK